jgi:hypothetical protein
MQYQDALKYLRESHSPSESRYREACEVVADNLDKLSYRVFIHLPGNVSEDPDAWVKIKAASWQCCDCGSERIFAPNGMRYEFVPSAADPIEMLFGDTLSIRPIGATASIAPTRFKVGDRSRPYFSYEYDPTPDSIACADTFSMSSDAPLVNLVRKLEGQGKPVVVMRDAGHVQRIPLLGVSAVDLKAGTVTLILDAAFEVVG